MTETVTLTLTDAAHGGEAIGRVEGRVVFVPGGLPGETARVTFEPTTKRFARARLVEIVEASPDRAEPPCPYYGECGGCQWQHASYEAQLRFKRHIVVEQLRRIGRFENAEDLVREPIGMIEPWAYRNNARFARTPDGVLGFNRHESHEVIAVESCALLEPPLNAALAGANKEATGPRAVTIRSSARTGHLLVDPPVTDPAAEQDQPRFIEDELLGHRFRISPGSFFQVNTRPERRTLPVPIAVPWIAERDADWSMAELLALIVLDRLPDDRMDRVIDAYSGVGTFTLMLAGRAREVIAIEGSPVAMADAHHNTRRRQNVRHRLGTVERTLPRLEGSFDAAVLDPARAGCHPAAIAALTALAPPRVVYVSCDPATLARDLRMLVDGGYGIDQVEPIDLFPQTYHIETVTTLSRAPGA